jgi:hypothetical protein
MATAQLQSRIRGRRIACVSPVSSLSIRGDSGPRGHHLAEPANTENRERSGMFWNVLERSRKAAFNCREDKKQPIAGRSWRAASPGERRNEKEAPAPKNRRIPFTPNA